MAQDKKAPQPDKAQARKDQARTLISAGVETDMTIYREVEGPDHLESVIRDMRSSDENRLDSILASMMSGGSEYDRTTVTTVCTQISGYIQEMRINKHECGWIIDQVDRACTKHGGY